jgi:hypothetical protein
MITGHEGETAELINKPNSRGRRAIRILLTELTKKLSRLARIESLTQNPQLHTARSLMRRPFFKNLLHKLFSRNQSLLNQAPSPVRRPEQGLKREFFHRDRSFIWFGHCASSLDHWVRPIKN